MPTDTQIEERQRQALELRRAGVTFDAIAERLGYAGRGAARNAYLAALDREPPTDGDEERDLESDRLDRMLSAVWPKAVRGDLQAVAAATKIIESRHKLPARSAATKKTRRKVTSPLERSVRAEFRRLTIDDGDPMAQIVLELVGTLDSKPGARDTAALLRELRMTLADLRAERDQRREEVDPLDELSRRRDRPATA
jgi:hypothetical protein